MLLEAFIAVSDLGRLREIAGVLIKYGFGDLLHRSDLRRVLAKAGHKLHLRKSAEVTEVSSVVRARQALEELGPTFAKLGQLLASRPDLLAPEWVQEFSRLHSQVSVVPFAEIRPQLEQDLGVAPEQAFARFDPRPVAAGTIAQVYRAQLHDGREVAVKVRRPGIAETVTADLRLLQRLVGVLEQEEGELRRFRLRQVVREFARIMRNELDFRIESRNLESISQYLADRDDVVLPEVVDTWTRERVLVMTWLDGCSAAAWLAGDRSAAFDPQALARNGADIVLQMVFGDGLYHGDPHPGNLLFLPDGRIGLLDFGQVGRLSESRRRELMQLLFAVTKRDEEAVVDILLTWGEGGSPDLYELTADVRAFIGRYEGVSLARLSASALLLDVTALIRENDLALPSDLAMLIKLCLTLEGLGRALHPEFNLSDHLEPAVRQMLQRFGSPRAVLRRNLGSLRAILLHLPSDLRSLFTRARRGELRLELDLKRLERFSQQINRGANRLTVGMITAALIIGTAIAMTTDRGPTIFGLPAMGLLGFLCSAAIGMSLLWSILRSGR